VNITSTFYGGQKICVIESLGASASALTPRNYRQEFLHELHQRVDCPRRAVAQGSLELMDESAVGQSSRPVPSGGRANSTDQ
jgi:hypothetical protein